MRRALWFAVVGCCASGCYTILRHPRVEDAPTADDASLAFVQVAPVDDCRACHVDPLGWDYDPVPCPPAWEDYYHEPWWTRVDGRVHPQGGGLANDRPGPPTPVLLPPPPTAVSPSTPTVVAPHTKSPGRATAGADRPHQPERDGAAPRRGERSDTPRPPVEDSGSDATPSQPEPAQPPVSEPPATHNQGDGMPARSPKP